MRVASGAVGFFTNDESKDLAFLNLPNGQSSDMVPFL